MAAQKLAREFHRQKREGDSEKDTAAESRPKTRRIKYGVPRTKNVPGMLVISEGNLKN